MSQRHPRQNEVPMLITNVTKFRKETFIHGAFAREAIEVLYRVQEQHPFFLYAFVIMPDHCHFLIKVRSPERISNIMRMYKLGVSHSIGIGPLWQSRFDLRVPQNMSTCIRYIHMNPVRKHLVSTPEAYPWSSACGEWDITRLG